MWRLRRLLPKRIEEMEIRKLEKEEKQKTRVLYEEVFSEDSFSFVEYYYREKTKDNEIYIIEEQDEIQAMIHLNPYTILVNQIPKDLHYIVAVATRKEFRGRGFMRLLLKQSMQDMYQAKEAFTFLMPAAEEIYTPYDFRTVYQQNKVYVNQIEGEEIRAKVEDAQEIAKQAGAYLEEGFQVYALREEEYYQRLIQELESDGYSLVYQKKRWNQEKICLPKGEEVPKTIPKIMIRLLHLETFFSLLKAKDTFDVTFEVRDGWIAENNKCYRLYGEAGKFLQVEEGVLEASQGEIAVSKLGEVLFGVGEASLNIFEKIEPLTRLYLNETV